MYMELKLLSPEMTVENKKREDVFTIKDKGEKEIKFIAEECMASELLAQAVSSLNESNLELFACKLVWDYMPTEQLKNLLNCMNKEQQEREAAKLGFYRMAK